MKKVIILGASSGIGNAIARDLAESGHQIICVARRRELLEALQLKFPDNIKIICGDICENDTREQTKNLLNDADKGIYLINAAAIVEAVKFEDMSVENIDQHYKVNFQAPLLWIQSLLNQLKGGRVLNISTGLAHHAMPCLLPYGVTKAALYISKDYLNKELPNIKFGSAKPGLVDTELQAKMRMLNDSEFSIAKVFQNFYDQQKLLPPEEVAKFMIWLLFYTQDEKFIESDWDIRDEWHHQYWNKLDIVEAGFA